MWLQKWGNSKKKVLTKSQALELLRLRGYTITDDMAATARFPSTHSFILAVCGWLVCYTLFCGYPPRLSFKLTLSPLPLECT